jgi:hypothetical protein
MNLEYGVRVWTRFTWLWTGTGGGFIKTGAECLVLLASASWSWMDTQMDEQVQSFMVL